MTCTVSYSAQQIVFLWNKAHSASAYHRFLEFVGIRKTRELKIQSPGETWHNRGPLGTNSNYPVYSLRVTASIQGIAMIEPYSSNVVSAVTASCSPLWETMSQSDMWHNR